MPGIAGTPHQQQLGPPILTHSPAAEGSEDEASSYSEGQAEVVRPERGGQVITGRPVITCPVHQYCAATA